MSYKRYRHAARYMLECQALDPSIEDYAAFETHDAFVNRIRAKHGRKTVFGAMSPSSRHHPLRDFHAVPSVVLGSLPGEKGVGGKVELLCLV